MVHCNFYVRIAVFGFIVIMEFIMRMRKITHFLMLLIMFVSVPVSAQKQVDSSRILVLTGKKALRHITNTYRGNTDRPQDFIPQGDGTVIDKRTGLQWMRCSVGQTWTGETCAGNVETFSWEEARKLRSSFADYDDWRLPTVWELETLIYCNSGQFLANDSRGDLGECIGDFTDPTIVEEAFPNSSYDYWTSTLPEEYANLSHADSGDRISEVSFYTGSVNFYFSNGVGFYVRLVRANTK